MCVLVVLLAAQVTKGTVQNVRRAVRGEPVHLKGYRQAFRALGRLVEQGGVVVVGRKPGFGHLESGRRVHVVRSPFSDDDATMLSFFRRYRPKYVVVTGNGLMPDQRISLFPFLKRHSEAFPVFRRLPGARILEVEYAELDI